MQKTKSSGAEHRNLPRNPLNKSQHPLKKSQTSASTEENIQDPASITLAAELAEKQFKVDRKSSPQNSRKNSKELPRVNSKDKVVRKNVHRRAILQEEDETVKLRTKWSDRDYVLSQVRLDGWNLGYKYISEELKDDREVVMEAVSRNGAALTYASEALKDDREVVQNAILSNSWALADASDKLKNDKKLVMQAVRLDGLSLAFASRPLRRDADVVLEAIGQDGGALRNAEENLYDSKVFVLEALDLNWTCFKVAPPSMQADADFVLECITVIGHCQILAWAAESLRSSVAFMEEVLLEFGQALQYASRDIRGNKSLVILAVQKDPQSLVYASMNLRNDPDVVLEAVRGDGLVLVHASKAVRADRRVVIAAVSQNRKACDYVSNTALLRDPGIVAVFMSQATPDPSRAGTPQPGESSRPVSRQSLSRPLSRQGAFTTRRSHHAYYGDDSDSDLSSRRSSCTDDSVYGAVHATDVLSSVLSRLRKNRKKHGLPAIRPFDPAEHGLGMPRWAQHMPGPIVKESAEKMMERMQNSGRRASEVSDSVSSDQKPDGPEDAAGKDDAKEDDADKSDKVVASFNTSWQASS
eukprot:gnl/MRDRNA2_/MRDRNA2_99083_c0_seq1.p1 gnl/MRDRNA2_/MRDRNA2_99083_c0~~gnl/MRDRNA2_/MRDRNA2_99083_c0_seq1.p1  ORF type:complete len:584 (-),score=93.39 gnl/MRDRNA2_/MRDRNA2_99083_c0_seq1:59-1810(-)